MILCPNQGILKLKFIRKRSSIDLGEAQINLLFQFDSEKLGRFEKHCWEFLVYQNVLSFIMHPRATFGRCLWFQFIIKRLNSFEIMFWLCFKGYNFYREACALGRATTWTDFQDLMESTHVSKDQGGTYTVCFTDLCKLSLEMVVQI